MDAITDPRKPVTAPGYGRPAQLRAPTSVRFLAALHVVLYHIVRPFSLWGPLAGFMAAGHSAVPFFFLLSGFILTYSHAYESHTGTAFKKRFYIARLARIYPLYLLSLLFAAGSDLHVFSKHIHILAFLADLLMVQSWSIRIVNFFNVPAWSLSAEAFFYLVFPFVFLRLRPRTRGSAVAWLLLFWALAIAAPLFALYRTPAAAWHEGVNGLLVFRIRRVPLLLLPEFLAGIPLAWVFLHPRPSRRASLYMLATGTMVLFGTLFFANHIPWTMLGNGLLLPLYAMIVLGLSEDHIVSRKLSSAPLVLLGESSGALYLFHFMFNDWLDVHFGAGTSILDALWKLAILIPLSIALYLLVEKPSRKRLVQWWNSHHQYPA